MAAERYDGVAVALHWTTVALVAILLTTGLTVAWGYEGALKNTLYAVHKAVGLLTFFVVAFRLTRRLLRGTPPLPSSVPATVGRVAGVWHRLLYSALLVMPVTGYVYVVAGGYPVEVLNALGVPPLLDKYMPLSKAAEAVHRTLAFVVIALVAGHTAAVVWHDVVRRDGVMRRMLPGARSGARGA
jgi:cytochrome b561